MANLFVELVAPDRMVYQGEAESVRVPGVEGSFTILANHAPMIAAFEVGPIFVTSSDGERIAYATSGGFIEVVDNRVTVLAETVEPATEIDVERARAAEERAKQSVSSALDDAQREEASAALERARNRLRIAVGQIGSRN